MCGEAELAGDGVDGAVAVDEVELVGGGGEVLGEDEVG